MQALNCRRHATSSARVEHRLWHSCGGTAAAITRAAASAVTASSFHCCTSVTLCAATRYTAASCRHADVTSTQTSTAHAAASAAVTTTANYALYSA